MNKTMNKLYSTLFYCLTSIAFIRSMEYTELELKEQKIANLVKLVPEDIGIRIVYSQLLDIHNQVNTPEEARDYLVNVSLVNKYCNQLANDPHVIRNIVSNLSATLRNKEVFIWYEEDIAEKLNTPATKKYLTINNQFFSEHLTKADVVQLLEQGADPNYRRSIRNKNFYNPSKYNKDRHYTSAMPLLFFASGLTDNDLQIARYLLEHGANIDKTAEGCSPPLATAIRFDFVNMVELLLSYNPKFLEDDNSAGRNYLAQATQKGNPEIINLLMKAPKPDFTAALRVTINKGNMQQIQELFNHGAKPDSLIKEVTVATVMFPYLTQQSGNWMLSTLKTTDILQLFCNNGIENIQILEDALLYAKVSKQRVKEVVKILEDAKNNFICQNQIMLNK